MAATAVKDYLEANGIAGRIRYYGCPAEEGGSAKGFMVREGVFDDVDIAISWHPAPFAGVNNPISLACNEIVFRFTGRASHAAASPHLGRSALDAVELMNVGVNYMREHMPSTARIHYAVTDTGGSAPNVVQANATVRYLIRDRDLPEMQKLLGRVRKIAEGAALMTETTVTSEVVSGDANLVGNTPLESLMHRNLERLGPPAFDEQDEAFAAASPGDPDGGGHRVGVPSVRPEAEARNRPVRHHRAAGERGRDPRRLHRCGDGQLGRPDGADARRDLCHRDARGIPGSSSRRARPRRRTRAWSTPRR